MARLKAPAWLAVLEGDELTDTALTMPAVATAATAAAPIVTFGNRRPASRLGMLGILLGTLWMRTRDLGKVKRGVKACLCSGAGSARGHPGAASR